MWRDQQSGGAQYPAGRTIRTIIVPARRRTVRVTVGGAHNVSVSGFRHLRAAIIGGVISSRTSALPNQTDNMMPGKIKMSESGDQLQRKGK